MRILLTGCAGFIGSHILRALIKNHDVVGVDNLSTGFETNITDVIDDFNFVVGDLTDISLCQELCRDVDAICHQAALPSVPRSVKDPLTSNKNNVTATLNLLTAAVDNGVGRFVYAASSSAYGNNGTLPRTEDQIPMPMSPYAVSKLTGEYYLRAFFDVYALDGISLRYFNVFGPRQNPNSQYSAVIPKFMIAIANNRSITIYGDGKQTRDFSYIDNVVSANVKALETDNNLCGDMVNIACGRRYSLNELILGIEMISGKTAMVVYDNDRAGDVKHSLADISMAKKIIGYEPIVDFKEGLKRTYEYYNGVD